MACPVIWSRACARTEGPGTGGGGIQAAVPCPGPGTVSVVPAWMDTALRTVPLASPDALFSDLEAAWLP